MSHASSVMRAPRTFTRAKTSWKSPVMAEFFQPNSSCDAVLGERRPTRTCAGRIYPARVPEWTHRPGGKPRPLRDLISARTEAGALSGERATCGETLTSESIGSVMSC